MKRLRYVKKVLEEDKIIAPFRAHFFWNWLVFRFKGLPLDNLGQLSIRNNPAHLNSFGTKKVPWLGEIICILMKPTIVEAMEFIPKWNRNTTVEENRLRKTICTQWRRYYRYVAKAFTFIYENILRANHKWWALLSTFERDSTSVNFGEKKSDSIAFEKVKPNLCKTNRCSRHSIIQKFRCLRFCATINWNTGHQQLFNMNPMCVRKWLFFLALVTVLLHYWMFFGKDLSWN